ncbi:MAG: hypothetical protein ACNI25_13990 [Halarcobacter sp.]
MLKNLFLILITTLTLNATSFTQRIVNIIGYDEYRVNKGLIDYLFSNEQQYYTNGMINYIEVMEKLQENGLLKISFNTPMDVSITFHINQDPIKSLKIISNSLKSLGYYHYFTKELTYDEEQNIIWTINLKTEAAIDPLMLSKELYENRCYIFDIKKEGLTKWLYTIDTANSILSDAKKITTSEKVTFRKPLKPYLLEIENGNRLDIISKPGNQWFPYVVFYDEHLNILEIVKENNEKKGMKLSIPSYTKYIKIEDIYSLSNINRGLSVIIKE